MNLLFKALHDPTRRKILEMLKNKELSAGEISEYFNISKPSISHHLDLLHRANLVIREKKGQYVFYSLNTSVLEDIMSWLFNLKNKTNEKN